MTTVEEAITIIRGVLDKYNNAIVAGGLTLDNVYDIVEDINNTQNLSVFKFDITLTHIFITYQDNEIRYNIYAKCEPGQIVYTEHQDMRTFIKIFTEYNPTVQMI